MKTLEVKKLQNGDVVDLGDPLTSPILAGPYKGNKHILSQLASPCLATVTNTISSGRISTYYVDALRADGNTMPLNIYSCPHKINTLDTKNPFIFNKLDAESTKKFKAERADYAAKHPELVFKSTGLRGGVSIGTDPEIFVEDENAQVIPAYKFLPAKTNSKTDVFWDGFQAEMTTPSGGCLGGLTGNVGVGLISIISRARKLFPKAKLVYKNVIDIPYEELQTAADEYVALGCAPSMNAYEEFEEIVVENPRMLGIRFAGAHMHFGQSMDVKSYPTQVKHMDAIGAVATTLLLRDMEDPRRRLFYGRPGEYRTPPHGLEYRVISSGVLCHPAVWNLSFDLVRASRYIAIQYPKSWVWEEAEVKDILRGLDYKAAEKLIGRNQAVFDAILDTLYHGNKRKAQQLIVEGARNLLPVDEIERNWNMTIIDPAYTIYDNPNNYTVAKGRGMSVAGLNI